MAWHTASAPDRETRVMEVLLAILGDGDSSRLHQRLVEKEQAALQVGTSLDQGFDPGLAWIYAVVPPGGDVSRTEKMIDEEIARLAQARADAGRTHQGTQPGAGRLLARPARRSAARRRRSARTKFSMAITASSSTRPPNTKASRAEDVKKAARDGPAPGQPHGRRARAHSQADAEPRRRPREVRSDSSSCRGLAALLPCRCCRVAAALGAEK